jgi:hypothetical protein
MLAECLGLTVAAVAGATYTVEDDQGRPVRGATVRVLSTDPPWAASCAVTEMRLALKSKRDVAVERVTDAKGNVSLPDDADGWLEVTAAGKAPFVKLVRSAGDRLRLVPARRLSLEVPAPNATVEWWDERGMPHSARTQPGKLLRLTVPRVTCLLAEAPGHYPTVQSASAAEGEAPETRLILDLMPISKRRIKIIGAAEATLQLTGESPEWDSSRTVTTHGGVAEVELFPPVRVIASAPGLVGATVIHPGGAAEVEIGLHPVARLELAVPSDASITLGAWKSKRTFERQTRHEILEVAAGTHRLRAETQEDALSDWVTLDAGTQSLSVSPARPSLEGRIYGPGTNRPVDDVRMSLFSPQRTRCHMDMGLCGPYQPFATRTWSGDLGKFSLAALDPGEYQLVAWAPDAGILRKTVHVPDSKARLSLEEGRSLTVHAPGRDRVDVFDVDEQGRAIYPALAWVPVLDGGARVEHLSGRVMFDAYAEVTVDLADAGPDLYLPPPKKWLPPLETPDSGLWLRGTVRNLSGAPVDSVCTEDQCGSIESGGRFAIGGLDGGTHPLRLQAQGGVLEKPVFAAAGQHPVLVALQQKLPRVLDPSGHVVTGVGTEGFALTAPGFVRLPYRLPDLLETRTFVMRPLPLRGHAPPGSAISVLCEDAEGAEQLHWSQHTTDVGPVTQWTHWPRGIECIITTVQAAPDGTFCIDSLPKWSPNVFALEARSGERTQRIAYSLDAGFDFSL